MADAYGKLTGRPGICFVTRGPGATNASCGVHIAAQDSTPMILFIGQVARHMREREAFQEVNYKQFFGGMAKWVVEVDDPARFPELIARAFRVAMQGRPGPVVVALPEDVLVEEADVADAAKVEAVEIWPGPPQIAELNALVAAAAAPARVAWRFALDRGGKAKHDGLERALRSAGRNFIPARTAVSARSSQLCRRPGHRSQSQARSPRQKCGPAGDGRRASLRDAIVILFAAGNPDATAKARSCLPGRGRTRTGLPADIGHSGNARPIRRSSRRHFRRRRPVPLPQKRPQPMPSIWNGRTNRESFQAPFNMAR